MEATSQALYKIIKGTGCLFIGTIISMALGFLTTLIIARCFSKAEYGLYNLVLTIVTIILIFMTLGFPNSLPRKLPYYIEKKPSKVNKLISSALIIVALNSIILAMLLMLGAEIIGKIFGEEKLIEALMIVAPVLPFSALTGIIFSISQGFGRIRERIYFAHIFQPIIFLTLVIVVVALNLNFNFIFFAYVIAQIVTFLALILYMLRQKILHLEFSIDLTLSRELILFSVPLFFVGILHFIATWTDTLMLGYYRDAEAVGLYNSASSIAKNLSIFLSLTSFLYVPLATSFYENGKIREMGRIYQILTKWVFILTLPIFTLIILYPEEVIKLFFGEKYVSSALTLQVLNIGFMFHILLGLNGLSLIIVGENKFIFLSSTVASIFNIVFNALLIPKYGLVGAAIATSTSYFVANLLNSLRLYQKTKIHPFTWNYIKLLVISFTMLAMIKVLNFNVPNILYAIQILIVFFVIYFFLVLLSRSFDKEDVELLLAIENRFGINLSILKKILKRFV